MKPRLATIDLNWLDGEIENLNISIEALIEKKLKEEILSTVLVIDSRLTLLSHELLVLHNLRKKCHPIEEPFTFVDTSIKTNNESILKVSGRISEKYSGLLYEEPFLSKTCTNNWESSSYCGNQNACELCKIKQ